MIKSKAFTSHRDAAVYATELNAGRVDWTYVSAASVVELAAWLDHYARTTDLGSAEASPVWAFLTCYAQRWGTPSIGDVVEYVETWHGDESPSWRAAHAGMISTVLICAVYGRLEY